MSSMLWLLAAWTAKVSAVLLAGISVTQLLDARPWSAVLSLVIALGLTVAGHTVSPGRPSGVFFAREVIWADYDGLLRNDAARAIRERRRREGRWGLHRL